MRALEPMQSIRATIDLHAHAEYARAQQNDHR